MVSLKVNAGLNYIDDVILGYEFHEHNNRRKPAIFRVPVKRLVFVDRNKYTDLSKVSRSQENARRRARLS